VIYHLFIINSYYILYLFYKKKIYYDFFQHSFDRREKEQLGLQHDISCLVVCLPVHYGAGSGNKAIKIFKVQN